MPWFRSMDIQQIDTFDARSCKLYSFAKKQKIKAIYMENKETRSQPPPQKAMPPINNPKPNRNGK